MTTGAQDAPEEPFPKPARCDTPPPMDVSDHLQRELTYRLNAQLLRDRGADPAALTRVLTRTLHDEGPRYHEPHLLRTWIAEAGLHDLDELEEVLESAIEAIADELDDEEEPWSAHKLLDLLAEEAFWTLSWGLPGESLPPPVTRARGVPVPLAMRRRLVRILDALEIRLHEAKQAQRSVHDPLPDGLVERSLDLATRRIDALAEAFRDPSAPGSGLEAALVRLGSPLPELRDALATIQTWKLAVDFDAAPDDDDGEWTLRVLERLYGIEWVDLPHPTGGER